MATATRASSGQLLRRYVRPQAVRVAILSALLLGNIVLQLINPQLLAVFVDEAHAGAALRSLVAIALGFLGIAMVKQLVSVAETYVSELIGWTATNRLRSDLTLHCLELDMAFHKDHTPGELIERVDGDVTALATFFSRFVEDILGSAFLLVGIAVLLFRIDWSVGLTVSIFTALAFAAANGLRGLATPRWAEARQASADLFGFLEERLGGTEDIRSSGATWYVTTGLYVHLRQLLRTTRLAALIGSVAWNAFNIIYGLGLAATLVLGGLLFRAGTVSLGTVYLMVYYTGMLQRPIELINRQMQDFQRAAAGIGRIHELLALRPALRDSGRSELPTGPLSVDVRGVTFSYSDDEPVLRDLNFRLSPGTVLGVLGRTGSGKTSLSRVLIRLCDPQVGTVLVGGLDVRDARLASLRQRIGMVTQEVQLFHATVRNNLTLFDDSVSDGRILEALHDVGLGLWYEALERGLNTIMTPDGMSAGQAQLLAFARVFLTDPGLVILDEASSRLDPATAARMELAIDHLLRNRTAVVIAHRMDTVTRADEIMVIEDGRIVEHGRRTDLAQDENSRFARLVSAGSGSADIAPRKADAPVEIDV